MKEIEAHYPKAFLARQGATFKDLESRLKTVVATFTGAVELLEDAIFYKPIVQDKWCPAEIADHVVKANKLFTRALKTALRGDDIIQMARGRITDAGLPISPREAEPLPTRERADLARALSETASELIEAARESHEAQKLADQCIDHAFFGPMTGLEVLQLAAWHIRHHEKQLPTFER